MKHKNSNFVRESVFKAVIVLLLALLSTETLLLSHHEHEDESFHSDCSACLLGNQCAVVNDPITSEVVSKIIIENVKLHEQVKTSSFFYCNNSPRSPPSS